MSQNIPPSLERFGEELDRAAQRQFSPAPARLRSRLGRPRYLAGGTLGVAGLAAAATLALSGGTAAPAFAVTQQSNGDVLVTVNTEQTTQPWAQGADQQLAAQGIKEAIEVETAPGPATTSGPVSCQPGSGYEVKTATGYQEAPGTPSGPPIKVLLDQDGTGYVPAGITGAGTVHLASCIYYSTTEVAPGAGNTGGAS